MRVMVSLGSIAWRSLFSGGDWAESRFQDELGDKLRADARIGTELEEHPHAGGGITDLSFRRIRIELKVKQHGTVTASDARAFADQTAAYAAGSGRRTAVICILDASPKKTAPGAPENDVDLLIVEPPAGSGVPIALGVVVLRANLQVPSAFSR